jgi:hypothetical protein
MAMAPDTGQIRIKAFRETLGEKGYRTYGAQSPTQVSPPVRWRTPPVPWGVPKTIS